MLLLRASNQQVYAMLNIGSMCMTVINTEIVRQTLVVITVKMQKLKSFIWEVFCNIGEARYNAYKRNPRAYWY